MTLAAMAQPAAPAAASEKLLVDGDPIPKTWEAPEYPKALREAKTQGTATAWFVVDENGAVQNLRLHEATDAGFGPPLLDAIKKAAFEPAVAAGKPLSMDVSLTWSFHLPYKSPHLPDLKVLPRTPAVAEVTPSPTYPEHLNVRRLDGEVLTEIVVGTDGSVRDAKVLNASTSDFVRPALEAVKHWKFRPARQGDLAIEERKIAPLTFEYQAGADEMNTSLLEANGLVLQLPEGATEKSLCDSPPAIVVWVDPVFPPELLKSGEPAEAEVAFTVNAQGVPENVSVRSASHPDAGLALRAAVDASLFRPAMLEGKTVEVTLVRKHRFQPPSSSAEENETDEQRLLRAMRAGETVASGKGLDARIRPVWRTMPILPAALKEAKVTGNAEVEFVIDRTGRARVPRVLSATQPEFGWAAATAVSQWVFDPPTRGGQPVDVRIRVPMEFKPE